MKKILIFLLLLIFSAWSTFADVVSESETETEDAAILESLKSDLTSTSFVIDVSWISPGVDITDKSATTNWKVNYLLWTIIQKMMIALAVLSVLIMTVWGWYIILHNWQDELLSKWKSIFMSWVYSIVVALSSYYLIAIVRFVLYNTSN